MIYNRVSGRWIAPSILLLILLSSCNSLRRLGEHEYLLNKNTIKTDHNEFREEMQTILKQKPNRKILGVFRFHLGIYNLANRGKETRFKSWVKRTIGEAPVIVDSVQTRRSSTQLKIYMENHGYFHAVVTDSTIYKKRHKANVVYTIEGKEGYTVRAMKYRIKDDHIAPLILNDTSSCIIKPGDHYDYGELQNERDRITAFLKNNGYYFFNNLYINYVVDSGLNANQVDIYMQVNPPAVTDSSEKPHHQQYVVSSVYIQTDHDPIAVKQLPPADTVRVNDYYFTATANINRFRHDRLLNHIFIQPGLLFRQDDLDRTYKRLQDLAVFKFINIRYTKTLTGDSLICNILLTPAPRQDYKLEAEGTNTGGNLGVAGNIGYRNKNVFRGAEQFEFRMKGGLEAQREISDTTNETNALALFNTYEIGPEISLGVPRILFPGVSKYKFNNPLTNFASSYNYQQRPEYRRTLANLSFSYTWKETQKKRHYIYPAEVNFVKVDLSTSFADKLRELGDPALMNSYQDQLIANGRYSFIYNNQDLTILRNHIYFKASLEYAGNTLWLSDRIAGTRKAEGQHVAIFRVPYAQYLKPDLFFNYYQIFNTNSQMVYHLETGLGYAYGNSELMPFEKSFYAGGSNNLRAWRARSLGPGTYTNSEIFEKNGDIKINANTEYRFDIFRKLEGALFLDAGNIWLVKKDEKRPGGHFEGKSFAEELALGTGAGLRLDFTFFILRFDWGIKLKDPTLPKEQRWVIKDFTVKQTILNFGIGYPF
jgi:outer membrane protein assembly factor BamA